MKEPHGSLPTGWARCEIRNVIIPSGSRNPKMEPPGVFRYVDVGAVDNAKQIVANARILPRCDAPSRARMLIRSGDVIFCLVRPYLKNIAVVLPELDGEVASTAYCVIRPHPDFETKFLFHQLIQDSFINSIQTYGTSPPSARDKEFLRMPIQLAPLAEQRRIVAKIEELFSDLDAGVAALERVKANLKRYRAAVLKAAVEGKLTAEWRKKNPATETGEQLLKRILAERRKKWEEDQLKTFAERGKVPPSGWREKYQEPESPEVAGLAELPAGWCWATVGEVGMAKGGIQKQPMRRPVANAFPYLRVANVLRDRLDLRDMECMELFGGELEALRLQAGDLLIVVAVHGLSGLSNSQ